MGITTKEIIESAFGQKKEKEEEKYKFMSKIYFETRKAVEYRLPTLKKQKKK